MLVVISDLHFVDETAGKHNFSSAAFTNVFYPHLLSVVRAKDAREVKLVLLGDTFDFLHTEQWFEELPEDRPWGANGLADIPVPRAGSRTCSRTLKILGQLPRDLRRESVPEDTILYRNWESLEFIRTLSDRLREDLGHDLEIKTVYLPGNHDRIVNLYPELRSEVARITGATVAPGTVQGDPDGEWWFLNELCDTEYGVLARHGHQFDVWNYGGGERLTREAHLEVPIGDVLGVEFGAKLPHELAKYRAEHPAIDDQVMEQMEAIALVRPFTHALQWLTYQIKSEERADVRGPLSASLKTIIRDILDIRFVQTWRNPNTRMDEGLRAVSNRLIRWIPKGLLTRLRAEDLLPFFAGVGSNPVDPDQDLHLRAAFAERSWRVDPSIHYVVYGHTHFPLQRPLDGAGGHEVMYVNTGTWRDCIYKTVGLDPRVEFMRFGRITYTFFYRGDEDLGAKAPGVVSFETWVGLKKAMGREAHGRTWYDSGHSW